MTTRWIITARPVAAQGHAVYPENVQRTPPDVQNTCPLKLYRIEFATDDGHQQGTQTVIPHVELMMILFQAAACPQNACPRLVRDYSHTAKLLNLVLEHRIEASDEELILQRQTNDRVAGGVGQISKRQQHWSTAVV